MITCKDGKEAQQPPCKNGGRCIEAGHPSKDNKVWILEASCNSTPAPPPGGWKCDSNTQSVRFRMKKKILWPSQNFTEAFADEYKFTNRASVCSEDKTYNFVCRGMDPANPVGVLVALAKTL